jgi:hypothetical protein
MRAGLSRIDPTAQVFFSPVSLGADFWLPKLAEEIAEAQSFLLLIGPSGKGPWTRLDRHVAPRCRTGFSGIDATHCRKLSSERIHLPIVPFCFDTRCTC